MTCSTIATDAIRKIEDEYLTAAAGPTSHSPPPIDVAAMIAPGPITFNMLRKPNGGGAGRSLTSHGARRPWPGGSVLSGDCFASSAGGIGAEDSDLRPTLRQPLQESTKDSSRARLQSGHALAKLKVWPYCMISPTATSRD